MKDARIATNLLFQELEVLIQGGRRVVLPVKGKSMLPFLKEGRDKVVLVKADYVAVGDVVLAYLSDDRYVLHRVFDMEGDRLTLMGDGNVYGKESCLLTDVKAKVIAIQRKGREVSCSSHVMIRRVRCWKRLLPIRRYLLFIYRHLC